MHYMKVNIIWLSLKYITHSFPFRLFSTTTYDFIENFYNIAKNNLSQNLYVMEVENATLLNLMKQLHPKVVLFNFIGFLS